MEIDSKWHVVAVGEPLVGAADSERCDRDAALWPKGVAEVVVLRAVMVHAPDGGALLAMA